MKFQPKFFENDSNSLIVGVNNRNNFDCYNVLISNNESKLGGFGVDLMMSITEFLNISSEYITFQVDENYEDSTKYDVILCDSQRHNFRDYFTVNLGRYSLLYKTEKLHFNKDIFILTFAGTLWLVFLVLLVFLALCLRIASVQYSKIYSDHEPWSWVEITLWAIAAACQQGLGNAPNGFASRVIFFLGYLMAYLLYTGFAAAITSVLLQYETPSNLETISKHTSLVCLTDYDCLSQVPFGHFKNRHFVSTMDELFTYLDRDGTVIMAPEVYFQYSRKKIRPENQIDHTISIPLLNIYKFEFSASHNNSWATKMKSGLNRLTESGILQNILFRNLLELPRKKERIQYGYSSAAIEHVKSAIYILFYGICAAAFFLIAERLFALYKSKKRLINQLL
ncbi:hypothetical protein WA026_012881 [Henosepilachna vigintioctopunctata]|uniref:Ionotropic glutamate receptor C-terminal domain-containing protein n=1 Tax=Henosepilachna vigintioctopunctata TaxID=420089 RepID=A0AAW1TMH5_9CUCU